LQWKVEGKEFELRVGLPTNGGKSVYAWVPGQAAFNASGATLQMLDYLSGINAVRLKNWVGVPEDEVDEIESGDFYAQRDGDEWSDKNHKKLKASLHVKDWLEKLTHERVMSYVDDAEKAKKLRAQIESNPSRDVTLKDRHAQPIRLRLARVDGKLYALSTARPDGVFEVYPDSDRALEPPRKNTK
jgi:hypothetical protein